jgi:predicted dehydrogenase
MNHDYSTVRWGILAPGNIAKRFAEGLKALPDAKLVAVGSRTQEKADAFADEFDAPNRHGSYQALVDDPNVDIVYVASPHPLHKEHSLLALNAGKAVLCEKPFTINAAEAREVIETARRKNLLLIEGMWSRWFPAMARLRELVREGAIGDVRMVQADFGFRAGVNPEGRLFNPALGGGALLDVGVYCVSFAAMLLGTPSRIEALATLGETGVDEQSAVLLGYPKGEIALLSTAIRTNTPQEATVIGTDGHIKLPSPWWNPKTLVVKRGGQDTETLDVPYESNGFHYEAAEAMRCLREGKTESDVLPLDETVAVMETLDAIRARWGLKYPME